MSKSFIIGSSGFSYPFWFCEKAKDGRTTSALYDCPKTKALTEYDRILDSVFPKANNNKNIIKSVEINCTRYRKLSEKMCSDWYKKTSSDFVFTIKAPTYITHTKRLKDFEEWWDEFEKPLLKLKEKLGAILFQFHETFECNDKNIDRIKILQDTIRDSAIKNKEIAFEFRNKEWFSLTSPFRDTLKQLFTRNSKDAHSGNDINCCVSFIHCQSDEKFDFGSLKNGDNDFDPNNEMSFPFSYFRFHGTLGYSVGTYGFEYFMNRLSKISSNNKVYIYFNNVDNWEPFIMKKFLSDKSRIIHMPVNTCYSLYILGKVITKNPEEKQMISSAIFDIFCISYMIDTFL